MIIVADNLHIVNTTVADALQRMDPQPIKELVRRCEKAGAQAIDINSGPLTKWPEKHFTFLVETVQEITSLPLLLDTTNPSALEAGLAVCRRTAIINGFSLEPAKIERILPLAEKYDVDIVGYLLEPNSQVPIEEEEMMTVAVALFETFSQTGLETRRLIIDPIVTPLTWQNGVQHNKAVLSILHRLPDLLGEPVRTIAGLSNLASGPAPKSRKIALESTFLPMLAAAGLDLAMMNVFHGPTVHIAGVCNALLGEKVFVWSELDI